MRYIKTFENINDGEIGDYILPNLPTWKGKSEYKMFDKFRNYINKTPGVIIKIVDSYGLNIYIVKYVDMPHDIDEWLEIHGSRDDILDDNFNQRKTNRYTKHDNIVFGKTLDKIKINREIKNNTNKYNL